MRLFSSLIAIMLLTACASSSLERKVGEKRALDSHGIAYISVPSDGRFGDRVFPGSGTKTAQAVAKAFGPYLRQVDIGAQPENLSDARRSARQGRYTYLLFPQILHWQERGDREHGATDKVSLRLAVFDVASGQVLDTAVIEGEAGAMSFGRNKAEDLLVNPLDKYASRLF